MFLAPLQKQQLLIYGFINLGTGKSGATISVLCRLQQPFVKEKTHTAFIWSKKLRKQTDKYL